MLKVVGRHFLKCIVMFLYSESFQQDALNIDSIEIACFSNFGQLDNFTSPTDEAVETGEISYERIEGQGVKSCNEANRSQSGQSVQRDSQDGEW